MDHTFCPERDICAALRAPSRQLLPLTFAAPPLCTACLPACLLGPQVLHSTVVEILLFMTPRHRADIVASLVASLNATYARFKCRNPSFEVGAQLQGGSGR